MVLFLQHGSYRLVLKMVIGGLDKFIKMKDKLRQERKTKKKFFKLNKEQKEALKFLGSVNDKFDVSVLQAQLVLEKL